MLICMHEPTEFDTDSHGKHDLELLFRALMEVHAMETGLAAAATAAYSK